MAVTAGIIFQIAARKIGFSITVIIKKIVSLFMNLTKMSQCIRVFKCHCKAGFHQRLINSINEAERYTLTWGKYEK